MNLKNNKFKILLIVCVVILLLAVIAFFVFNKNNQPTAQKPIEDTYVSDIQFFKTSINYSDTPKNPRVVASVSYDLTSFFTVGGRVSNNLQTPKIDLKKDITALSKQTSIAYKIQYNEQEKKCEIWGLQNVTVEKIEKVISFNCPEFNSEKLGRNISISASPLSKKIAFSVNDKNSFYIFDVINQQFFKLEVPSAVVTIPASFYNKFATSKVSEDVTHEALLKIRNVWVSDTSDDACVQYESLDVQKSVCLNYKNNEETFSSKEEKIIQVSPQFKWKIIQRKTIDKLTYFLKEFGGSNEFLLSDYSGIEYTDKLDTVFSLDENSVGWLHSTGKTTELNVFDIKNKEQKKLTLEEKTVLIYSDISSNKFVMIPDYDYIEKYKFSQKPVDLLPFFSLNLDDMKIDKSVFLVGKDISRNFSFLTFIW